MRLESPFLRSRPGSGVITMLCIAIAAILALVPVPDIGIAAPRGSAFSAATSDQCLAIAERHLDARRSLQKAKRSAPIETAALAPEIPQIACVDAGTQARPVALARVDLPAERPSNTRARAPPFA